jgi:hypothetical protein
MGQVKGRDSTGLSIDSEAGSGELSAITAGRSCGGGIITGVAAGVSVTEIGAISGAEGRSALAKREPFNDQKPKMTRTSTKVVKAMTGAVILCLLG